MDNETIQKLEQLADKRTSHLNSGNFGSEYLRKLWYSGKLNEPGESVPHSCYHYVQIKDNQLYMTYKDWGFEYETRIEAGKFLLLSLLSKYEIPDVEFIYHDDDKMNTDEHMFVTSCRAERQQLMGLSFNFCHYPEANLPSHEAEMEKLFGISDGCDFASWIRKKTQICFRGHMNASRHPYKLISSPLFDLVDVNPTGTVIRGLDAIVNTPGYLSREEKTNYKYLLQLNGQGEDDAYSAAFVYALASKSLVFYATQRPYQEWWIHPDIFQEGVHYVRVSNPAELVERVEYYSKNDEEAYRIASNGYEFSKKFLTLDASLHYYQQCLRNLSKLQPGGFDLMPGAKHVTTYRKRLSLEEIVEIEI